MPSPSLLCLRRQPMPPSEIHIVVTPGGIFAGFVGLIVLVAVVFLGGVLSVVWPQRSGADEFADAEFADAECADAECAEAVELPSRRLPPPRTGTIHAPQYRRSDDDTVPIEPAETRR